MLRMDIYEHGAGVRVRLHHHPYGADDSCGPECEEEAAERAYPPRKARPGEVRAVVTEAAQRALNQVTTSHQTWMLMLGEQMTLDV